MNVFHCNNEKYDQYDQIVEVKKYVKKPNGSVPGYVIYTNNKTIYVTPSSLLTTE